MSITHKTRQEMANEYGIDVKTFLRWVKKAGIELPKRDRLSPKLVQKIYTTFGIPDENKNKKD